MAHIAEPVNNQVKLSPYAQRLIQYGVDDSRIYLSRNTNGLLHPYTMGYYDGKLYKTGLPDPSTYPRSKLKYTDRIDCIIDGLENSVEMAGRVLVWKIQPGQCIVDSTLLTFPKETELDIDVTEINTSTNIVRCILSVNFQWLETLYEQPPKLKLTLIDPNDTYNIGPDTWETRIDRLIISYVDIDIGPYSIVKDNFNPIPCLKYSFDWIPVRSVPYEVGPCIKFLFNFSEYVDINYAKKRIVWTPECLDPTSLKENEITFPIEYINQVTSTSPIVGVSFDINYDPNLICNPVFIQNNQLSSINKLVDVFIDSNSNNEETGLLRIQIGQNASNNTVIPTMNFGYVKFDFKENAIRGNTINITVTNITATYNNSTTGPIAYVPRDEPTTEYNLHAPAITYNFQAASVDFGKVDLQCGHILVFDLNEVRQRIVVSTNMLLDLTSGAKEYYITPTIKLYKDISDNLHLIALDGTTEFTDITIEKDDNTEKTLSFKEDPLNPGEWIVADQYWYWTPTEYDLILVTYNSVNLDTIVITPNDMSKFMANPDTWLNLTSMSSGMINVYYENNSGISNIKFRIDPSYVNSYTITDLKFTIKNGSSIISQKPSVLDYHREQHLYNLGTGSDINLTDGDYIIYNDNITNTDTKVVLTEDVLKVIKDTRHLVHKLGKIQVSITYNNLLCVEPIDYDTKFNHTHLYDTYVNKHEPTVSPVVWFPNKFISTRPVTNISGFTKDPNKLYTTCWKFDSINKFSGERDFYCEYSLEDFRTGDVVVQVFEDGDMIQPQLVNVDTENKKLKLYMPEQFILKDPDKPPKSLKMMILG